MKIQNVLKLRVVVLCGILVGGMSLISRAEGPIEAGNGVQGANRRVRTNNGFSGVTGTFTEPPADDMNVPARYNPTGNYILGSNRQDSKPSFYLGSGSGDRETDGGIQWEFETLFGGHAGWSAFISWSHAPDRNGDGRPDRFTNPVVDGEAWRVRRGGLGRVTLTNTVLGNGATELALQSGAGSFTFHWDADLRDDGTNSATAVFPAVGGRITNAALTGMNVKRVVAMTQRAAATRDGSFMANVVFESGDIARPVWQNGNLTHNWLGTWPINNVNQGETGYIPSTQDGQGRWVVDFDFTGMRAIDVRGAASRTDPTGTYRDAAIAARYPSETVHIHLRQGPARPAGRRVRRGPRARR